MMETDDIVSSGEVQRVVCTKLGIYIFIQDTFSKSSTIILFNGVWSPVYDIKSYSKKV